MRTTLDVSFTDESDVTLYVNEIIDGPDEGDSHINISVDEDVDGLSLNLSIQEFVDLVDELQNYQAILLGKLNKNALAAIASDDDQDEEIEVEKGPLDITAPE